MDFSEWKRLINCTVFINCNQIIKQVKIVSKILLKAKSKAAINSWFFESDKFVQLRPYIECLGYESFPCKPESYVHGHHHKCKMFLVVLFLCYNINPVL